MARFLLEDGSGLLLMETGDYLLMEAALAAGELAAAGTSATKITVIWTNSIGGVGSVTAQLQRSAHGADTYSDVAGKTTSPATDTGRTTNTTYDYRVKYTDGAGTIVYSNTIAIAASVQQDAGLPDVMALGIF